MTREEAIKRLSNQLNTWESYDPDNQDLREAIEMAMEAVQEPGRKKGKWIECQRVSTQFHPDCPSFYSVFVCTSCLKENYRTEKYCPNCGAKMDEERKDER